MKVPVSWLREYVSFDLPIEELGRRLVFTSCEVDRIVHRGVPDTNGNLGRFRVGRVARGGQAPERRPAAALQGRRGGGRRAPDRLRRVELRRGRDRRRRAARRHAPERPRARAAEGARRALGRDDPRRGRGRPRHRPHGDHAPRPRARAGHAARRRPAARGHRARDRDGLQPARPDGVYGIAREVSALLDVAPRAPAGPRARARRRRARRHPHRGLRALPALHRAALPRRGGRRVPAVAQGPPARRRHAPDLERRRRDQLRDARARQPAARLRPRQARGGPDRRAPCRPGRAHPHAGRHRAGADDGGACDRRRRAARRRRRDHGRRGDRGVGRDRDGAARGRELRAARRPAQR